MNTSPVAFPPRVAGLLAALIWTTADAHLAAQAQPMTWMKARPIDTGGALTYDIARERVVLFSPGAATWEWDGAGWQQRAPVVSPPPRGDHAMAYDMARQRVVLFGGQDAVGRLADTWEWDGASWQQRSPSQSPPARLAHAMVYDAVRQRIVLFGGSGASGLLGETWEWDGANWTLRNPASSPAARAGHGLAYDVGRQRTVLFGGCVGFTGNGETWEWDGSTWLPRSPSKSPPGGGVHGRMAYDIVRRRVVVHGVNSCAWPGGYGSTWEWDGTSWAQQATPVAPAPRWLHSMAYDALRQRVVLFGGSNAAGPLADTWEWDGARWSMVTTATSPGARDGQLMTYDQARQRTILFGSSYQADTWLYGPLVPAATQPIGNPCVGTNGPPLLTSSEPYLANAGFTLDLLSARPSAACILGLSAAPGSQSMGGGCTLYLRSPIVCLFTGTNPFGFASATLTIPADISLRGTSVYAQAVVADPQGPAPGLAFSAGRRIMIGD